MEKEEGRDRKEGEKKFRRLRVPRAHTRAAAYSEEGIFGLPSTQLDPSTEVKKK